MTNRRSGRVNESENSDFRKVTRDWVDGVLLFLAENTQNAENKEARTRI